MALNSLGDRGSLRSQYVILWDARIMGICRNAEWHLEVRRKTNMIEESGKIERVGL